MIKSFKIKISRKSVNLIKSKLSKGAIMNTFEFNTSEMNSQLSLIVRKLVEALYDIYVNIKTEGNYDILLKQENEAIYDIILNKDHEGLYDILLKNEPEAIYDILIQIEKEAFYDILYQKEIEGIYDIKQIGKLFGALTDAKIYILTTSDSTILDGTTEDS